MNRALVINADIVIIVSEDIVGQDTLPQFVPKNTAYYIMYCNYILYINMYFLFRDHTRRFLQEEVSAHIIKYKYYASFNRQ